MILDPALPSMRAVRECTRRLTIRRALAPDAGCAAASARTVGGQGSEEAEQSAQLSSRDTLTAAQLLQSTGTTRYDALRRLRPEPLNGHHLGTSAVYVDDVRQSKGMDRLKRLAIASVVQVPCVPPARARLLPGEVSGAGALVVTLK